MQEIKVTIGITMEHIEIGMTITIAMDQKQNLCLSTLRSKIEMSYMGGEAEVCLQEESKIFHLQGFIALR